MVTTEENFLALLKKMGAYSEALSIMFWDMRTGAPKKGIPARSEVVGTLSSELFKLSISAEMEGYLDELEKKKADLDPILLKTYEEAKKEFDQSKKIPAEEYRQFVVLSSQSESAWEEAKETADFEMFLPYLEKIVATTKKFIGYWGEKDGNAYNTLLDQYEPGMTTDIIDEVFNQLKETIVPLVKKINESEQPDTSFLFKKFPKENQKAFSHDVLTQLGYDFDAGRLDETVHPFATSINIGDVRITTKYDEFDFRSAVFGTIHECGHALYEQNIDTKLEGLPIADGTSMGIHESQSLFYEQFVGHNENFWKYNFDLLKRYSPDQFEGVSLEGFLRAVDVSKPSLIRIEADELTYPLHIMIRYEIEKGLFNGDLEVKDLPQIWNDKYEEYLGVRPKNNGEGVLQDVHWAGGAFGYFPSYALGYMYAAQLKVAMLKDLPDFDELCLKGEFSPILDWLTEHVHKFGKMKKPLEIIKDTTGEGLNAKYLADYLSEKYTRLYNL
ncbi:carboxypeptidase M32 [Sporosarcina sp. G11-34]|uniref:carboxypeptidase M32 n=1 Tax=Sporosarcina sp. G11-34 TaxID=2849605 RepID=UPI0022A9AC86|nr:carboxypeptidase M32 [Sporosarcina sp. G11-34]MCZ2258366.1 carboxypeptidase M32 [Sporosarcina sp. G11-34]